MFDREELLAQAQRRYPDFLRAVAEKVAFFPLEVRIGKTRRATSYAERAAELAAFRAAAESLRLSVEWRPVNDPRFGLHDRPERAFFADEAAYLQALGKTGEVQRYSEDLALIRTACPALEDWLSANARAIVEQHGYWPELLRVVAWFRANPRSDLYLRQIPVEGVDTKFFEQHESILDALLTHLQSETIDLAAKRFAARHGLRWEEPLIRLRFLDAGLQSALGFPVADLAVPAPSFRTLGLGRVTAIVTENLRNFLALPALSGAVAVLGSGDAAALLAGAEWLAQSRILYWGDMDARGYAILARLRGAYPQTESVLMDLSTIEAHRRWAVTVEKYRNEIPGLTTAETEALQWIGAEGLWLEQERVPFPAVVETLIRVLAR